MTRFQERRFSVAGPGATRDAANCAHGWVGRVKEQYTLFDRKPTAAEEQRFRAMAEFFDEINLEVKEPHLETVGVCMFCGAQVRKVGEAWERV